MPERVDVVVLGMGVGGEEVAGRLAEAGLSVVGIDDRLVGGECPYWGCIPSKMMIRAANLLTEARRVPGMAGHTEVSPDWAPVAARIRAEATDNWDDKVAVDRFTGKGGKFVRGRGRLTGPGRVTVGDTVFDATRAVVVGTGTVPTIPPVDGLAATPYWTNRQAIEVETLPASLIVLGGGAIGVELAQVFARFGVAVTIVESQPRLLALEEPESSDTARAALTDDNIEIHTGIRATRVAHDGTSFTVTLSGGTQLTADRLLVATGRHAELAGLGVETVGLDPTGKALNPDERMRIADRMWAVGDVTGKGAFTHVSVYQARIATRAILGEDGPPADYRALPRVTFTDPEIGAVGLTESQAREQGLDVRVYNTDLANNTRGWLHHAEGFIKLIESEGRLVGGTAAGPMGGEILGALAVAVHGEVPVERLRHMMYAFPTFHRALDAALL
jgi:pyruvate/2-oxoglutarate dehydrogenase complex dihydrolipoamide dehydrogenase (E3) component